MRCDSLVEDLGITTPTEGFRSQAIELSARLTNPDAQFVGISVNTVDLNADDSKAVLEKYAAEFELPCVDPIRTGVTSVVDRIAGLWPETQAHQ